MEIKIFIPISGCPCCADTDEETVRCAAFVEKLREKYGDSVKVSVFPSSCSEFLGLKNGPAGRDLTAPVVIVDGVVVSSGGYPHNV